MRSVVARAAAMASLLILMMLPTLALAAPPAAAADTAPAASGESKHSCIRRLLALTGDDNLVQHYAQAIAERTVAVLRHVRPDLPRPLLALAEREAHESVTEASEQHDPVEDMVEIYDRHFTHEEIDALLAFYDSPLGRKSIAVLPQISAESAAVGEAWGHEIGPQVQSRVRERLTAAGVDL
ncbi:MAG: DUF2059 domain-containing protein [Pseudomonadota bacterium]|nr:DUF2059 domain-containing protein [Pseudomonadota bacterium]HJO35064.1 DUF2059 domain-containing protein [Gammaproteobacteria bacterium]